MVHDGARSKGNSTLKLFYVYIVSSTAKQVNLPKFVIVTIGSNAPTCPVHAGNDGLPRLVAKREKKTQRDKNEGKHSIKAVHYNPIERGHE